MKDKVAKIIRTITAPPVLAFIMLGILYWNLGFLLGLPVDFLVSEICLAILPACAYPIAQIKSSYSDNQRECERETAFMMSLGGYLAAFIYGIMRKVPDILMWILSSYFMAAVVLTIINRGLRIMASGHACSCVLPCLILCYFCKGSIKITCLILYFIEFWATTYLKRHTVSEFWAGSCVAVAVFCFTRLQFGIY
ncbi:MAG: hypothetical protein ACI4FX_02820 [Agathobacter sp.]